MTIDEIIQGLQVRLDRALRQKRKAQKRAGIYRAGLVHVVELPAVTKCELVRAALEAIDEGKKVK